VPRHHLSGFILFVLAAALAACGQPKAQVPTASATQEFDILPVMYTLEPVTCTVVGKQPAHESVQESIFPRLNSGDWVFGPEDAGITIIEYCDLQSPVCAQLEPELTQILENYAGDVCLVYRHFPLQGYDKTLMAAQAAEAAGRQGKEAFFEFLQLLYSGQADWYWLEPEGFPDWLDKKAAELGLDTVKFSEDYSSGEVVQAAISAQENAYEINIPGAPFLLINDVPYQGPRDYANMEAVIRLLLLEDHQFNECPQLTVDTEKHYQATIHTSKGDIVLLLYADKTPVAVNNFIFLAREGWYDGVSFHRVVEGLAQAGDPSGTGFGGPGYAFNSEIDPTLSFDETGVIAMVNSGPNTNGSQFFITSVPFPEMNGLYPIFGSVTSGLDVLHYLTPVDPAQGDDPQSADKILSVTIEER
jgi:cyclophilin family peptidyl-prolyl cis-trans isomerase/protein-disulfide isomerase